MKYAVFSDVHANASALRRMLADARSAGVQAFLCLGDLVGYGPEPAESIRLVRKTGATVLIGNHDAAVAGRLDTSDFTGLAADSISRHRAELSKEDVKFLSGLPHMHRISTDVCAAHGDFVDPHKFCYVEDVADAEENFNSCPARLMFVGHTHVPCIFVTGASGKVYKLAPQDFTLEPGKRYIVNPGSVGYPREAHGECYSSYVIYDTGDNTVSYRRLPFRVESVMQRGGAAQPTIVEVERMVPDAGWRWAAVGALALALAAFVVWMVVRSERTVRDGERALVAVASAEPVAEKTLALSRREAFATANLELERGSPKALLFVLFHHGSGRDITVGPFAVTLSSKRKLSIPDGSISATFKVVPAVEGAKPRIKAFEPSSGGKADAKRNSKKRNRK